MTSLSQKLDQLSQRKRANKKEKQPLNFEKTKTFKAIQNFKKEKPGFFNDINRIVNLPIKEPITDKELEEFNYNHVLARRYNEGFRFFRQQAEAILEYERLGGVFCPIGVGKGKTLITLLIAEKAWRKGNTKIVIFLPPEVYAQLVTVDIPDARTITTLSVPFFFLGGNTQSERTYKSRSGRPGCYIIPYSVLSCRDGNQILTSINPQTVIADEAHRIARASAARTKRFVEWAGEAKPEFIPLSGSITKKSIRDYHHLMRLAIAQNSPLPLSTLTATDWGKTIDAKGFYEEQTASPLKPLLYWARAHFGDKQNLFTLDQTGFRKAYQFRLRTSPGVVATSESEIGTSLIFRNTKPIDPNNKLEDLIKDIEEKWQAPNGDEIDYALHKWQWLYQLTTGFYYNLYWPSVEYISRKFGVSKQEALDKLQKAKILHKYHQIYNRKFREWSRSPRCKPGLDTPFLTASSMARVGAADVGGTLYRHWSDVEARKLPNLPERLSEPIEVCDFKVQGVLDTVRSWKEPAGIVWYHHRAVGDWIYRILSQELGKDGDLVLHCPAGNAANRRIIDKKNKNKVVVASTTAHGTGKNLQFFHREVFAQWPRPADRAEQVLGRLHRTGQEADELFVDILNWSEFDDQNFAACLIDSIYQQTTTGLVQKLVYGNYQTLPKFYPPEFLKEKGFLRHTDLSKDGRNLYRKITGKI